MTNAERNLFLLLAGVASVKVHIGAVARRFADMAGPVVAEQCTAAPDYFRLFTKSATARRVAAGAGQA